VGIGGQGPGFLQDQPQRFAFVQHPGVHRRDQRVAVDEVHLEGQDAKQEDAVGARRRAL
jgi:hypothetical protein